MCKNENKLWEPEIVENKSIHSTLFLGILSELYIFYLFFNLIILPRQANIEGFWSPLYFLEID